MGNIGERIKTDWKEIPLWAKIGTLIGGLAFFVLTKRGTSSASGFQTLAPSLANQGTTITSLSPTSSTGTNTQNGTSTGTQGTPSQSTDNTFHAQLPNAMNSPVHLSGPLLTPSQQALQDNAIQSQLGSFGGQIISKTNPYAGLGANWDTVTVSQTQNGGTVTNLGFAQPAPNPGQVIPTSVQNSVVYIPGTSVPDWEATLQNAYQYPSNFAPGMLQPKAVATPSVPVYQPTVPVPSASPANINLLSQESAAQSAAYQQSVASGGYTSGGQAAFNASHPLSSYAQ